MPGCRDAEYTWRHETATSPGRATISCCQASRERQACPSRSRNWPINYCQSGYFTVESYRCFCWGARPAIKLRSILKFDYHAYRWWRIYYRPLFSYRALAAKAISCSSYIFRVLPDAMIYYAAAASYDAQEMLISFSTLYTPNNEGFTWYISDWYFE